MMKEPQADYEIGCSTRRSSWSWNGAHIGGDLDGVLAGLVDRAKSHDPDNGFCALRVKALGQWNQITRSLAMRR